MKRSQAKAQTAIEYLLLLAVVVAIVLVSFTKFLPRMHTASNVYFNRAASVIMGKPNPCGDGVCSRFEDREKCCVDCGGCKRSTPPPPDECSSVPIGCTRYVDSGGFFGGSCRPDFGGSIRLGYMGCCSQGGVNIPIGRSTDPQGGRWEWCPDPKTNARNDFSSGTPFIWTCCK